MSTYFKEELKEGGSLVCPCGCGATPKQALVNKLDNLRELYRKPIYTEQGATCKEYSVRIGRSSTSSHISGEAVDFKNMTFKTKTDYFELLSLAIQLGFTGIGQGAHWIGAGTDKRLHLDIRLSETGDTRSWTYGV